MWLCIFDVPNFCFYSVTNCFEFFQHWTLDYLLAFWLFFLNTFFFRDFKHLSLKQIFFNEIIMQDKAFGWYLENTKNIFVILRRLSDTSPLLCSSCFVGSKRILLVSPLTNVLLKPGKQNTFQVVLTVYLIISFEASINKSKAVFRQLSKFYPTL